MKKTGVWSIDRRPSELKNVVIHPRILKEVGIQKDGINRNFIFYGSYGKGKTTLMVAISKLYDPNNVVIFDASRLSIADIRDRVTMFMAQARIGKSLIVFDEVDSLPSKSQEVLSSCIERSANTNFICTGNNLKFHKRLLARLTVVDFDLSTKELIDLKPKIMSYYQKVSDKELTQVVLDYLLREHKDCIRGGVQELQKLNVICSSETITSDDLGKIKSTKPILRAVFFSDSTDLIYKEIESYGVDYIINDFDIFYKYADELKMPLSRDRIILETMDAMSSLSSVYETSLRKVVTIGIILKVNKIVKSDPLRAKRRDSFLNSLTDKNKYK